MEVEKYEVLEEIGRGSFGVIKKVRRKQDGQILCRKEISYFRMSPKEREQLQAELAILKGLRHNNIVAYYEREHLKSNSVLHIYMEYCEHGDLGKRIKHMSRNNLMAEEDFVWSVFAQLVTALYRCHYGEDPPEVGKNVIGLGSDAKPIRSKTSHTMILHRDLKPENIFLGADSSVKLGDFGLSKIIASHEFASTYVGTPFYMSPEICAGEPYSLYSDIWAFGCIMYELCAKEPPFNAKTHLDLIQKIRLGKVKPLSSLYSQQLQETIQLCLRVNAHLRPDTVQLLNLPMVKLKRKEMEVVVLGKQMKVREEIAMRKLKEFEIHLESQAAWKEKTRSELDDSLRREWELKARLEIDRQVQSEVQRLQRDFQTELSRRVEQEVFKRQQEVIERTQPVRSSTPDIEDMPNDLPFVVEYQQSQSTSGEPDEFPSTTELSELSLESPTLARAKPVRRSGRAPLARAQTMFEGSPLDVSMVDPSPAPIASLGLSPRRSGNRPLSQLKRNIFATAADNWSNDSASSASIASAADATEDEDDGGDGIVALPSPTRSKLSNNDPFKAFGSRRPGLMRQKTAPINKLGSQPTLFSGPLAPSEVAIAASIEVPPIAQYGHVRANSATSRRLAKMPSVTVLSGVVVSPARRPPAPPTTPSRQPQSRPTSRARTEIDVRPIAVVNNHNQLQGRTLVELAQARIPYMEISTSAGEDLNSPSKPGIRKTLSEGAGGAPLTQKAFLQVAMAEDRPKSASTGLLPATWDPERDEMPSPFLVRGKGIAGSIARPGMSHLR